MLSLSFHLHLTRAQQLKSTLGRCRAKFGTALAEPWAIGSTLLSGEKIREKLIALIALRRKETLHTSARRSKVLRRAVRLNHQRSDAMGTSRCSRLHRARNETRFDGCCANIILGNMSTKRPCRQFCMQYIHHLCMFSLDCTLCGF